MTQSRRGSLAETAVNTALGCAINWTVLWLVFGKPLEATGVTLGMIVLSSARLYVVRRWFSRAAPQPPRSMFRRTAARPGRSSG